MSKIAFKNTFICLILLFFFYTMLCSCASPKAPQGGPKDTTSPKPLKISPKNLSTNFNAKKIVIEFNEFIKLQNQFKEFSISPEQEKAPVLKARLKRLEITFQDSLEKNTTYTLNFGKSIVDVNESNELKNFSYIFSTGSMLDSLSISGKVINAISMKPEPETLVFIIPKNKDSIFGKKRPSIYTLADSAGNFKLTNLKKDTYKIYALKEKGGDKIYQQSIDEIGFMKDSLVLEKNVDSILLSVFKEIPSVLKIIDKKINNNGIININLNKKLINPELTILEPKNLDADKFVKVNKTKDSLKMWLPKLNFDSLKISLKDQGKEFEQVKITRQKRDTYNTEIKVLDNLEGQNLNPTKPLKLYFNYPIKNLETSKIQLLEDSIPRNDFKMTKDSLDKLTYNITYWWKEKEEYILKIKENAITGFLENKNKEILKKFKLGNLSDYGTLHLNVSLPDTNINYIIELLNENRNVVLSNFYLNKNKKITFSNYKSGIYFIRVLYDENKNGIWDTGNLKEKKQPEKYWYSPKEFSIKANWDREEKIIVPNISEVYKQLPVQQKPKTEKDLFQNKPFEDAKE